MHGDSADTVSLAAALELFVPADATNKVDAAVLFEVSDSDHGAEDQVSKDLGVKLGDWCLSVELLLLEDHTVPLVLNQQSEVVGLAWSSVGILGQLLNVEVFSESFEEALGGVLLKGLEDTVVVENFEVIGRVEQSHEEVERLISSVVVSL